METVKTRVYTVRAGAYTGRIMSMWLHRYAWVLVIPFGFCGCMAFYRWEWIVAGVALLLLIYPFVLSFVYFRYGMSPASRREILPRKVTFNDNGLEIEILKVLTDDKGQTCCTDEDHVWINYSDVRNVNQSDEGMTLRLKQPRYAHVFVPAPAFETPGQYDKARMLVADKVKMA